MLKYLKLEELEQILLRIYYIINNVWSNMAIDRSNVVKVKQK